MTPEQAPLGFGDGFALGLAVASIAWAWVFMVASLVRAYPSPKRARKGEESK